MAESHRATLSGFLLSAAAARDLSEIQFYLDGLPSRPASRIGTSLFTTLQAIAEHPYFARANSELSLIFGEEIRSRHVPPYRIYYRIASGVPEILGILHTARDISAVLRRRLQ